MHILKALLSLLSFLGFVLAILLVVWRTVLERVEGNTIVSVMRLLQQGQLGRPVIQPQSGFLSWGCRVVIPV